MEIGLIFPSPATKKFFVIDKGTPVIYKFWDPICVFQFLWSIDSYFLDIADMGETYTPDLIFLKLITANFTIGTAGE